MRIGAVAKLTLLDYPGHLACTVFLNGCNLRCPYCHNASLVLPEQAEAAPVSQDELLAFLKKRQGLLEGVCITGGEPTLQPELPALIRTIRDLGYLVKLDTNGSRPDVLAALLEEGLLDYVAMDIKNSPQRYRLTCGGAQVLEQVRQSAALLLHGGVDYEFRTTVCHPLHTPEDLAAIGFWLRGAKRYYLQPFVDSGHLVGTGMSALTPEQLQLLLQAVRPYLPCAQIRGI